MGQGCIKFRRSSSHFDTPRAESSAKKDICKILLLGGGNVGKSTIFKAVLKEDKETGMCKEVIFDNLSRTVHTVLGDVCRDLGLEVDVTLKVPKEASYGEEIDVHAYLDILQSDFFKSLWERIRYLQYPFQIPFETMNYMLTRIDDLRKPDYTPTQRDCTMARARTTGIISVESSHAGRKYSWVDTGGERSERRKWVHCFDEVDITCYVTDSTGFARKLFEDDDTVTETEYVALLKELRQNERLKISQFLLVFNKSDVLRGVLPYVDPSRIHPEYVCGEDYDSALEFIAGKYGKACGHSSVLAAATVAISSDFSHRMHQCIEYLTKTSPDLPAASREFEPMLLSESLVLYPHFSLFPSLFAAPRLAPSLSHIFALSFLFPTDYMCEDICKLSLGGSLANLKIVVMTNGEVTLSGMKVLLSGFSNPKPRLENINFSGNKIEGDISEIFDHTSLRHVDLCRNVLAHTITAEISKLKKLETLCVGETSVQHLPIELTECVCLSSLSLPLENMRTPPREVCDSGLTPILQFLLASKNGQKQNTNMRLMVIGLGEVGKTSLIRALVSPSNISPPIDADTRTIGVDVIKFEPKTQPTNRSDPLSPPLPLSLDFWDFAGQKVYYLTHSLFMTRRAVYILAFRLLPIYKQKLNDHCSVCSSALRRGEICVSSPGVGPSHLMCVSDYKHTVFEWISKLQYRVPGAMLVLVATHADCLSKQAADIQIEAVSELVNAELAEMKSQSEETLAALEKQLLTPGLSVEFMSRIRRRRDTLKSSKQIQILNGAKALAVSSRTGENIEEFRAQIISVATSAPFYGENIPVPFLTLRERLSARRHTSEKHIPLSLFLSLCSEVGVVHSGTVAIAVDYLRDVGELMYFPENSKKLKETIFIDPKWVSNLMKGLINHDHTELASLSSSLPSLANSPKSWGALRKLQRHGILTPPVLPLIWNGIAKPEEYSLLLALLEALELIVKNSDEKSDEMNPDGGGIDALSDEMMWIVPCLLSGSRNHEMNFPDNTNLHMCRFVFRNLPEGCYARLLARLRQMSTHATFGAASAVFYLHGKSTQLFVCPVKNPKLVFGEKVRGLNLNKPQIHIVLLSPALTHFLLYKSLLDSIEDFYPGLTQLAALVSCACPSCLKAKARSRDSNNFAFIHLTDIGKDPERTIICPLHKGQVQCHSLLPPDVTEIYFSLSEYTESSPDPTTAHALRTIFETLKRHYISYTTTARSTKASLRQPDQEYAVREKQIEDVSVFAVLLDDSYTRDPSALNEYRIAVGTGKKSIIPLILPGYSSLTFPKWYPDGCEGLDGLLFVDIRTPSSLLPSTNSFISQTKKFLETSGRGRDNLSRAISGVSRETSAVSVGATPAVRGSMICKSCLEKGICPPYLFYREDVIAEYSKGNFSVLCELEGEAVPIITIMPTDIFISYNWGKQVEVGGLSHGGGSLATFENQERVKRMKRMIEEEAEVVCWLDVERMGGGSVLDFEMQQGIQCCSIVLLCLDDAYTKSKNCLRELEFSSDFGRHIIPLLMPGLETRGSGGHWCPDSVSQLRPFPPITYNQDDVFGTVAAITRRIDALLRRDTVGSSHWRNAEEGEGEMHKEGFEPLAVC